MQLKTLDEGTVIVDLDTFGSEICIFIILTQVADVGEVWEAAELSKEKRQEEQCQVKSKWANEIGQVVQEEEEVGEQDLAGQGAGWGERGGNMIRLVSR